MLMLDDVGSFALQKLDARPKNSTERFCKSVCRSWLAQSVLVLDARLFRVDYLNSYFREHSISCGPGRVLVSCFRIAESRSSHKGRPQYRSHYCCQRHDYGIEPVLRLRVAFPRRNREYGLKTRSCDRYHKLRLRTASTSCWSNSVCHDRREAGLKAYLRECPSRLSSQTGDVLIPLYLSCSSCAIAQMLTSQETRTVIQRRSLLGKYHYSRSSVHPFRKAPSSVVQSKSNHPCMCVSWYTPTISQWAWIPSEFRKTMFRSESRFHGKPRIVSLAYWLIYKKALLVLFWCPRLKAVHV